MKSKSLKTPLRYPGGKSRACTKIESYFPDLSKYKEYREPFLGGGSVALYVFVGLMYVGSGYRQMSKSFNRMLNEPIVIMEENYRSPYEDSPMIIPHQNGDFVDPQKSLGILY